MRKKNTQNFVRVRNTKCIHILYFSCRCKKSSKSLRLCCWWSYLNYNGFIRQRTSHNSSLQNILIVKISQHVPCLTWLNKTARDKSYEIFELHMFVPYGLKKIKLQKPFTTWLINITNDESYILVDQMNVIIFYPGK